MPRRNESFVEVLAAYPWWVSVLLAGAVLVVLRGVVPSMSINDPIYRGYAQAGYFMAPFAAALLLIPALFSAINAGRKRKLLDKQKDLETVRALHWREFEELVGEAYRRQGYTVQENSGPGADGGVDLVLRKQGNVFLVQCKNWRQRKVGVKVVREMYGLMTALQSNGVIIITSGMFTQEARTFAAGKPIDLIEGQTLMEMIGKIRSAPPSHLNMKRPSGSPSIEYVETAPINTVSRMETKQSAVASSPTRERPAARICPKCGAELVSRTAKRGPNAGQKFWGCSNYPKCRATLPYGG